MPESIDVSMRGDEDGRRFAIVTVNGKPHEHLITKQFVKCDVCNNNPRVNMILVLVVDRFRSGL